MVLNVLKAVKYRDVVLFSLCALAVAAAPWLALVVLGVLVGRVLNSKIGNVALAISLILFLSFFNATKQIGGDWSWYVDGYQEMWQVGLLDYLKAGGFSIRISEPIYYVLSYIISVLSGGNVVFLALSVTITIYGTYVVGLEKFMKSYGLYRWTAVICIVFALLAGVTFTQTLHLIRQYIAGSILFVYFMFIVEKKNKKAAALFAIGALVHNSFIIPGGIIAFCALLFHASWVKKRYTFVVAIMPFLGYVIGSILSMEIRSSDFARAAMKNDGAISSLVYIMDGLLLMSSVIGMVLLWKIQRIIVDSVAIGVLFLVLFSGFLIGIHDWNLLFLRLYFFIEWFRVIGVASAVWILVHYMKRTKLALAIIPASFIVLGVRVELSPWDYGGGVLEHLISPVYWWAAHLI